MLVVHPSSQCDVCLDPYNWSTSTKTPHAIQCGHIFCYDCLRSTVPSSCPMCRKAFNPERIKKLHVDRAPGDAEDADGSTAEENEFLRRIGLLFTGDSEDEDINALVTEVGDWLMDNGSHMHPSLSNAITALHQYKQLLIERREHRDLIKALEAKYERHAHVNQTDNTIAHMVEQKLVEENARLRQEFDTELAELRSQNAHMQSELDRYFNRPNPLPRPPEISSAVRSRVPDQASAGTHSSQRDVASLGLGVVPASSGVAAPTSQSRSSSGGSRARAPSVHFAGPPPPREINNGIDTNGVERRQVKSGRPHHIVPGAPHSQRVIPPRLTTGDASDATPRPLASQSLVIPPVTKYPPHLAQYAPKPDSPCIWVGDPDAVHQILPNEVSLEELEQIQANQAAASNRSANIGSSNPPPVIPPPPPGMPPMSIQIAQPPAETGSTRLRPIEPDGPLPGRTPMDWRSRHAPQEDYVMLHLPNGRGVRWISAEEAIKFPIRARGTITDQAYVIAKDPRDVDDGWREEYEDASNPLQLSGLPAAPLAVSSSSAIHRGGQHDAPAGSSSLFRNAPGSSDRTIVASISDDSFGLGSMGLDIAPAGTGRAHRGMARTTSEPLGLGIASLPQLGRSAANRATEPLDPEPSPAPSWGTIQTMASRHSSLGNLRLNNLPPPPAFGPSSESLEQLPIGELNGGPIVLTDAITPRQGSSVLGDDWSVPSRSDRSRDHRQEPEGLLFVPSAGSSRQVVSSLHDLEDVNRSLMQLAHSQEQEPESRRSSRPSTRHSRQPSLSGDEREREPMVGLRTGIALYSSRPATNYSSSRGSSDPSTGDPSPPAQSRPRSGASTRSHAESTYSSHSSHSHHSSHSVHTTHSTHSSQSASSHRSSDAQRRARRGSTASALDGFRDQEPAPAATWTAVSAEMQPYGHRDGASREPYTSESSSRSQKSQESIPRAMDGLGSGPGSMSSLLLSFDPPSTSSAVTGSGEEAAGIHAPRPVNGRRASMLNGAWNARSGR